MIRAQRAAAIHNPTIRKQCIDPNECARQVNEKQERIKAAKAAEIVRYQEMNKINRMIEAEEMKAKSMRKRNELGVQESWHLQRLNAKTTDFLNRPPSPINTDKCGLGASQKFDGEDRNREERKRRQQLQMKQWTSAQQIEKDAKYQTEKAEMVQYVKAVDEVDKLCAAADIRDQQERKKKNFQLARVNQMETLMKRNAKQQEWGREMATNQGEIDGMLQSPFLSETGGTSIMDFKGFSPAVRAQYERQNQEMVQTNAYLKQQEREQDHAQARAQQRINREVQRNETAEAQRVKQQQMFARKHVEQQRMETKERNIRNSESHKNVIGPGFYEHFGTSER